MEIKNIQISPTHLFNLLSRVSLDGSVEHCLLKVKEGVASVMAVDMTNSIFLIASEKVPIPDCELGLCNVKSIIQTLAFNGSAPDSKIMLSIDGSRLVLKNKGCSAGFALMENEEVPTAVTDDSAAKKVMERCEISFQLPRDLMGRIEFYTSTFPSEIINIVGKRGSIQFRSSSMERNSFHVTVCETDVEDFSTTIYSSFLLKAIKQVFAENADTEKVLIMTGNNAPVIVVLNKNNFWAITPVSV